MPSGRATGGMAAAALAIGGLGGVAGVTASQPDPVSCFDPAEEPPEANVPPGCGSPEAEALREAAEKRLEPVPEAPEKRDDWSSLCRESTDDEVRLCVKRSTLGGPLCATFQEAKDRSKIKDVNCVCRLCPRWRSMVKVFKKSLGTVPPCPPS